MVKFNDLKVTPDYDIIVNAEIIETEDSKDSYVNVICVHTNKTWDGDADNGDHIYRKELFNPWYKLDGTGSKENPYTVLQLIAKSQLPPPVMILAVNNIKCCITSIYNIDSKIVNINDGIRLNLTGLSEEEFKKVTDNININKAISLTVRMTTTKDWKYSYEDERPAPYFEYFTDPNASKKVALVIRKKELDTIDFNNLYYVSIIESPYAVESTTTEVSYNKFPIFEKNMKYIKELDSKCEIPKNFIDTILKIEAIDTSIKAKDYFFANELWDTYNINCQ